MDGLGVNPIGGGDGDPDINVSTSGNVIEIVKTSCVVGSSMSSTPGDSTQQLISSS